MSKWLTLEKDALLMRWLDANNVAEYLKDRVAADDDLASVVADVDAGVRRSLLVLKANGVETYECCQGGARLDGSRHAYLEPTIRFYGQRNAGWRALSVAQAHALPVRSLKRIWTIEDGEPNGPNWEITFREVPHHLSDLLPGGVA